VSENRRYRFEALGQADLVIDAVYEGGSAANVSADPLGRLLPCGNQGGFRYKGPISSPNFVVLYSDLSDHDWPDVLDVELGRFTYYGDNKKPGHELHDTVRGGNAILRSAYELLHGSPPDVPAIPPFFIFTKGLKGRDVVFRGMAVPGSNGLSAADDLVAIWRTTRGQRFQNYRAAFTVLDAPVIRREWLDQVAVGQWSGVHAPAAWRKWQARGTYTPLLAPVTHHRNRIQQLPEPDDRQIIEEIIDYFPDPHGFEICAARIWEMHAGRVEFTMTRPSRDGGRDAFGDLRVGPESDPVRLEFALEAKCYDMGNAVGVRELARLISRIRNRMFGVLVTTSFLQAQAYQEMKADGHPIVVIAARDIVDILREKGYRDVEAVRRWLEREFPPADVVPMAAPYASMTSDGR
jgi:hypothetical protein